MSAENSKKPSEGAIYVLVEEEAAIRTEWLKIAKTKGLALMTYPDPHWLLADIANGALRGNERFYLDHDMHGVRGVGVALADVLKKQWPYAFTALVTAYPKSMFRDELARGLLNDVFGKFPAPFENQAFTAWEKRNERDVWTPMFARLGSIH